jgi:hypothetical protein
MDLSKFNLTTLENFFQAVIEYNSTTDPDEQYKAAINNMALGSLNTQYLTDEQSQGAIQAAINYMRSHPLNSTVNYEQYQAALQAAIQAAINNMANLTSTQFIQTESVEPVTPLDNKPYNNLLFILLIFILIFFYIGIFLLSLKRSKFIVI